MKLLKYTSKAVLLTTLLSSIVPSETLFAAENANHTVTFNLQTKETKVDGNITALETPASVIQDRLYVPVRFLSNFLGFQPNWDEATRTISFTTNKAKVTLKPDSNEALINDQTIPFDSIAALVNNNLLLSARKMSELVEVPIDYNAATSQVTIVIGSPKKELQKQQNAKPIAQFTTDKKVYRIGEPIEYIDLSYDPDGWGYYNTWSGRQDAFFTPGKKQITLSVKDTEDAVSEPFSQTIEISNNVLTSEEEYPFYFGSMDDDPKRIPLNHDRLNTFPLMDKKELRQDTSRKVILSDSPENFTEFGILYQEKVKGKARLYGTHENHTGKMAQLSVVITNPTSQPIKLRTTHEGLATPSKFPEQQGQQALVNWYLKGEESKEQVIAPGQSIVYYRSGPLFPELGTNFMYDIETDGEAQVSFIANDPGVDPLNFKSLKNLPKGGNVRGTFDAASIDWEVDASKLQGKPGRVIIGDPASKSWVKGHDGVTGENAENEGNYGVFYNIEFKKPGKAAFALVPRGGAFKGTVLFNNTILPLPESGVVFAFQGYLIGRTDGSEDSVKLQVVPPSGSSLPFDILVYPLDNRK
ncbi:MAG TPA: copper amine oxidase N-terminal domain-containing protein [Bacillota bacterium]|nr:copper amine oxidase N-terminal domain-containing protein [Bacillota bacterium]